MNPPNEHADPAEAAEQERLMTALKRIRLEEDLQSPGFSWWNAITDAGLIIAFLFYQEKLLPMIIIYSVINFRRHIASVHKRIDALVELGKLNKSDFP